MPTDPAAGRPDTPGRRRSRILSALAAFLIVAFVAGRPARPAAQLRPQPVGERPDVASLTLALRQLDSIGTFMQTTAHPDDEDNALLAMLSHGEGMRAVLVTATRGDGGQNEIGPELFQALGVLRTAELEAVHRFDGAEQYFTRAVDFGYSFSVDETIQKWGRDVIVGDYVRHIRATRPDVIAGFLCGGDGGGQHHQASTILTLEAFRAAADPARYPEQLAEGLRPWQARRVFCTEGFGARGGGARSPDLLAVDATRFDPVLGRRYSELGIEARSMHKCQGTSQLLPLPGEFNIRTYRLRDAVPGPSGVAPPSLFDGIDTSLAGLVGFAGDGAPAPLRRAVAAIQDAVTTATHALGSGGPEATAAPLAAGLAAVRALRHDLPAFGLDEGARYEIDFRLARKERQFETALVLSHGMEIEALASDGTVVPGQPVTLSFAIGNRGSTAVTLTSVDVAGLTGGRATCSGTVSAAGALRCAGSGTIPADAAITGPYWHPRADAARYDFDPGVPFGVPFAPSPFTATLHLTIAGAAVDVTETLQYRYSDLVAGEKRMEISVVPALAVSLSPDIIVVPASAGKPPAREVEVVVTNQRPSSSDASVRLQLPAGWTSTPAAAPVHFGHEDEEITARFTIGPPAAVRPGAMQVKAVATAADGAYDTGYRVVEYPHIQRRDVPSPAAAELEVLDVSLAPDVSVGYVMGVGDQVPQALRQLGATVTLIDPAALASGDLSQYSVIMTGVRAYERRPDLRANNNRLIEYAKRGGTVIVQYNKFEFNQAQYGPYPAKVSSNRVTDETAPVQVLAPDNPVFTTPNRLGPETWEGWVQERGLYFLGDHDPQYADLVRLEDPFDYNRGPKTGALVEATVGEGRWLYVGLGLWRQLPAGTPGAYRLMANLISLH